MAREVEIQTQITTAAQVRMQFQDTSNNSVLLIKKGTSVSTFLDPKATITDTRHFIKGCTLQEGVGYSH